MIEIFSCQFDDMMGQPKGVAEEDDLNYVCELQGRLEDAYEMASEHPGQSDVRQKRYYDVRVNNKPYKSDDLVWAMNKIKKKEMCPEIQMRWTGSLIILKHLNDVTYQVR